MKRAETTRGQRGGKKWDLWRFVAGSAALVGEVQHFSLLPEEMPRNQPDLPCRAHSRPSSSPPGAAVPLPCSAREQRNESELRKALQRHRKRAQGHPQIISAQLSTAVCAGKPSRGHPGSRCTRSFNNPKSQKGTGRKAPWNGDGNSQGTRGL